MIRRLTLAIPAVLALMLASPAARASVMGEGACDGLGVHVAWLDWGTGKVSVAVFNHTGDGRWPAVTKQFRVVYAGADVAVASTMQTLQALKPVNVALFDYKALVGKDFSGFDGNKLLNSGEIKLADCAPR